MNILTFDIEEWFNIDVISVNVDWNKYEVRIYEPVDRILNALEKRSIKATFFCLGWIARKHPGLINKIKTAGHELGCHSDLHESLTRLSIKEFRNTTSRAIKSIEDVIGEKIKIYRAPDFSITEKNTWTFDVLIENGIEIDCSIFPASHDYGGFQSFGTTSPAMINVNGSQIKEFPLNTAFFMGRPFVFSGGGFFRFYPYWFIRRQMLHSDYVMTYFHPYDFDTGKPMLKHLPTMRKFKSYFGTKHAFSKLERLLDEFDFSSLLNADVSIDWEKVRVIKL